MLISANPNAFTPYPLDRAAHRRRDQAWLEQALGAATTQLVPFHKHRPFVVDQRGAMTVGWLGAHARAAIAPTRAQPLFLGIDVDGAARFALEISDPSLLGDLGRFDDLRALGPLLAETDLPVLGTAKCIFEWHARHGFCANCGAPSAVVEAGWKRECPSCGAEHFPRVDPVVIMTPVFGDKCLLGRQRAWPRGMYSALAGFVEPGETIEEAVARETLEEVGLRARSVEFHSTQPWPFPHSLMMGAICEVEDDDETIDVHELESARWFTRAEARALIAREHPDAFCPPPFAIAHQVLKTWAAR